MWQDPGSTGDGGSREIHVGKRGRIYLANCGVVGKFSDYSNRNLNFVVTHCSVGCVMDGLWDYL